MRRQWSGEDRTSDLRKTDSFEGKQCGRHSRLAGEICDDQSCVRVVLSGVSLVPAGVNSGAWAGLVHQTPQDDGCMVCDEC